jgi:hypothetical protein
MADDRKTTSAADGARGYKRSWKNLLINKRYQLRFTLFMVLVMGLLMAGRCPGGSYLMGDRIDRTVRGLGWWVMATADEATKVAHDGILGNWTCVEPQLFATTPNGGDPAPGDAADADDMAPTPIEPDPGVDDVAAPAPSGGDAGSADAAAADAGADDAGAGDAGASRRDRVQLSPATMEIREVPRTLNAEFAAMVAKHHHCKLEQAAKLDELADGRDRILWVLIGSGLLLVFGLAAFGLKMTHRVAGPLYKISLYMAKMRDGRYDKVYNLRKGDQLVDFYEHFKSAHAGVVELERADLEQLTKVLAAADAADVAGTSPEVDAALAALRKVVARKEKSLEQG